MKPFSQPFTDTIRLIDPVIVKKIVDALRDPQNKQITGSFHDSGCYCVIGIIIRTLSPGAVDWNAWSDTPSWDDKLFPLLGIENKFSIKLSQELYMMNDSHNVTFSEFADAFEEMFG